MQVCDNGLDLSYTQLRQRIVSLSNTYSMTTLCIDMQERGKRNVVICNCKIMSFIQFLNNSTTGVKNIYKFDRVPTLNVNLNY